MKTLKLFNAVIEKNSKIKTPFISTDGYIIEPNALWAKEKIIDFYKNEALNGNDLNKTFHKSWKLIKDSTREELFLEQILHYLSTYGTDYQSEVYVPDEIVKLPEVKIVFKVIKAYTKDQLIQKCLNMLCSGIALKEETIDDILSILIDDLKYQFTGKEKIQNKEAIVKIADLYNVFPEDFMTFFRYVIYKATGKTLIIKNKETINAIKQSTYNPSVHFHKFGLEELSEHFNRFKPLFLAFKNRCPKTINRISKLSKTYHKPMVQNPINIVTQRALTKSDNCWLDNCSIYMIFKAISATHQRTNDRNNFVYKIRNGKSWTTQNKNSNQKNDINAYNYLYLLNYLKKNISLKGKKVFIPENVEYALPTSEKMYVGNIPMGTKFYGNKLVAGIYWENKWGARDLDLSGIYINGKVGWNAEYTRGDSDLIFSGDLTDATSGAVEYLYAHKKMSSENTLFNVNVFNGKPESGYKIILGSGDNISREYMMNPNNLWFEVKTHSIQKQMIIGILLQEDNKQAFVLLNIGNGKSKVSKTNNLTLRALVEEWTNTVVFNYIITYLGAEIVKDEKKADINLSLNALEKDSFIKLFSCEKIGRNKK